MGSLHCYSLLQRVSAHALKSLWCDTTRRDSPKIVCLRHIHDLRLKSSCTFPPQRAGAEVSAALPGRMTTLHIAADMGSTRAVKAIVGTSAGRCAFHIGIWLSVERLIVSV